MFFLGTAISAQTIGSHGCTRLLESIEWKHECFPESLVIFRGIPERPFRCVIDMNMNPVKVKQARKTGNCEVHGKLVQYCEQGFDLHT